MIVPDSPTAESSWDLLVSPWHLEERIGRFPVPGDFNTPEISVRHCAPSAGSLPCSEPTCSGPRRPRAPSGLELDLDEHGG